MAKRVTISITVDEPFLALLGTALRIGRRQHGSALDQLGETVLAEARGATAERVDAEIPPQWRPHLSVVHAARAVEEVPA